VDGRPSRPAGLLVVALNGPGQVKVGDEPHVGLVDAHSERDRGHHDQAVLAQEAGLIRGPGTRVEPRMVRQRLDPAAHQELGDRLHRRPGQAVDDARVAGVLGAEQLEQLPPGLVLRNDAVLDVRAVEAGHEVPGLLQVQPGRDLGMRGPGRGRGQRDAGDGGPALVQRGQGKVVGAEVVPPLRYAVRLVDGEQRDNAAVEEPQRRLGAQPLGRQVEQVQPALQESGLDQAALAGILGGVEEPGPDPERPQRVHLILHQRDQRRYHDADALPQQRRDLVAQRLAAAGRHQDERVTAGGDVIDDLLLRAPERVIAEDPAQHAQGLAHLEAGFGGGHRAILGSAAVVPR